MTVHQDTKICQNRYSILKHNTLFIEQHLAQQDDHNIASIFSVREILWGDSPHKTQETDQYFSNRGALATKLLRWVIG